jgi:hypothetical protein
MTKPDVLSSAQIADLITDLDSRQLNLSCHITNGRGELEKMQIEQMAPVFFQDLAIALKRPEISGSLLIHDRIGKLLKGNVRLISESHGDVQAILIEHFLNHFPVELVMLQLVSRPSADTAMRMAVSFVDNIPLQLCPPGDLGTYIRMMSNSFGTKAFVLIAEHLLDHLANLEASKPEGKPRGMLASAPTIADIIINHHVALFSEEMNMENPFFQMLARYQDQLLAMRTLNQKAPSIHDMQFIEHLYQNGLDQLATCLSIEWIKDYSGTDLIAMLEDHGFGLSYGDLESLSRDLSDADYDMSGIAANLLDYSLVRPGFKMKMRAADFGPVHLELIAEKLLLNIPEDQGVLDRTGVFLDDLCAHVRGARDLLDRKLSGTPYWRHSAVLSEQRLQDDLGL